MRTLPSELVTGEPMPKLFEAVRLYYLLLFPNETDEAREALVTMAARAIGKHTDDPEELVRSGIADHGLGFFDFRAVFESDASAEAAVDEIARASLLHVSRGLFTPAGGFSGAARARGTAYVETKVDKRCRGVIATGFALSTLYKMHRYHNDIGRGGASMNKVWWLLERWRPYSWMPKAESSFRMMWNRYRDVAHLAAAFESLLVSAEEEKNPIINQTDTFLHLAKHFEDFGMRFPIFDPKTVWRVPLNGSAESPDVERLPLKAQIVLASYKAPISL
jgi:hypothetical protein